MNLNHADLKNIKITVKIYLRAGSDVVIIVVCLVVGIVVGFVVRLWVGFVVSL